GGGRPAVHRPGQSERLELGHDALLGREQRRAERRVATVGDHAGALYRPAGGRVRAAQLRLRRDHEPGAAAGSENAMIATRPVLEVKDLSVEYASDAGPVRAVDQVSLDVAPGEFIGIVGESGCGKSTFLFAVARLLSPPARVVSGSVRLQGRDLLAMNEEALREIRWRDYSVVMQSAMNALNPVLTVGAQLQDTIAAHEPISAREAHRRSGSLLRLVGIVPVDHRSKARSARHPWYPAGPCPAAEWLPVQPALSTRRASVPRRGAPYGPSRNHAGSVSPLWQ